MVEKALRIRRYERKVYTGLVDFPVEIVGKDGSLRRYSFEESIRLYHRRISSANTRLGDEQLVDAEVAHCRARVAQLRRSYLVRFGWNALRASETPGLLAGEFAGEVAAFLRKATGLGAVSAEDLEIALISEDDHSQVYFARPKGESINSSLAGPPPWMLYLFSFRERVSCPGRDAFFATLKSLSSAGDSPIPVDRVVAFHHTVDCGLILTGTKTSVPSDRPWLCLGDGSNVVIQDGLRLVKAGRKREAMDHFIAAYEAEHYRRAAYLGAVVLADHLGAYEQAQATALMGGRYFPDEPLLAWHEALSALRLDRPMGEGLVRLLRLAPGSPAVSLLEAVCLAASGRVWRGTLRLRTSLRGLGDSDPDLKEAGRNVLRLAYFRLVGDAAGVLIGWTGLVLGILLGPWLGLLTLIGGGISLCSRLFFHFRLLQLLRRAPPRGLRLSNPVSLRDPKPNLLPIPVGPVPAPKS
jgi:hypothetical protein